ncbi:glycosyltransferase [Stappia taiwanensis]|uniref:Glycosyltransferase n=1 Tax=Stappia taiwanensis TaxID=992267 RepID=A0A838XZK8_9HYPH|nr:glycosyltransferase [Stappia taiwanensis]MBA4612180.1 glycosyltransferase [Stappia taiwanensis]
MRHDVIEASARVRSLAQERAPPSSRSPSARRVVRPRSAMTRDWPEEVALLCDRGLAEAALVPLAREARRCGLPLGRVLLQRGLVSSDAYYCAFAEVCGVPFLCRGSFRARHDPAFPPPPGFAGPLSIGRTARGETIVAVVPPVGGTAAFLDLLRRFPGLRGRVRITTPEALAEAVAIADPGARLSLLRSEVSARRLLAPGQMATGMAMLLALLLGMLLPLSVLLILVSLMVTVAGMVLGGIRLMAGIGARESPRPGHSLANGQLPFYTVLVPLYREARVVEQLVASLAALDYPASRLEVLFLLEAEDRETRAALMPLLHPHMRCIEVPEGSPRTKPRALAHGLELARGELVTVFDGEDRPEPAQLRLAASRFAELPGSVAALQAHLAVDHLSRNLFARQFLLEYAGLFDCLLPFLSAQGFPFPLGGTSNHFRREALEEVGGWDPYNVTEDADLAVRLCRAGYDLKMLGSTTFEEAPIGWRAWHGQRTRWLKGWLQTLLVAVREPHALIRDLRGTLLPILGLYVLAMVTTLAAHPVFVVFLLLYGLDAAPIPLAGTLTGDCIAVLAGVSVVLCYASMAVVTLRGAAMRRWPVGLLDLMVIPFYWLVQSLAFYAAVVDLLRRPHDWCKTEHGVAKRPVHGRSQA